MSRTTLRWILAAVALLGAGYGAAVLAGGAEDSGPVGGPVAEAMRRAAGGPLDSIRIESGGDTVVLRRRRGGWRVGGHRADTAEVAALTGALGRSGGSLEVASRNPENHRRMGVDSAGAGRLVLAPREGDPVELLLGDDGPFRSSMYVRAPGTSAVYLVRGELARQVRQDPGRWRDRTVVAVDTSRVRTIRVRRGGTTYRLRRSDAGWRLGGAPADSARVRRLLGDLAGLEAGEVAPDTAAVEPVDREVTVLGRSAGDTLARIRMRRAGPESTPRYLVRARGREAVFELDAPRADRLAPAGGELRPGGDDGGPSGGSAARPDSARSAP